MSKLDLLKNIIKFDISDDVLIKILFDMNRYFDDKLKYEYKKLQKEINRVFTTFERRLLRDYYYYGRMSSLEIINVTYFSQCDPTESDVDCVITKTLNRLEVYDAEKITSSIYKRYTELNSNFKDVNNKSNWLSWFTGKNSNENSNLTIIEIDNSFYSTFNIYEEIRHAYNDLNNYRHIALIFNEEIYDSKNINITWKLIYEVSIYLENMVKYSKNYFPVKKVDRIKELSDFISLKINNAEIASKLANDFYKDISTGCKFEDCYISDDGKIKVLIFKKIVLDSNIVPCPDCLETKSSSNSYPEMFLQSWECKNENCPSRSKSGRGKRYDEFSTYRYFKTINPVSSDKINDDLYYKWRKDLFNSSNNVKEMLIKYYSWSNEKITLINCVTDNDYNRIISNELLKTEFKYDFYADFNSLPIFILFKEIFQQLPEYQQSVVLDKDLEIINGDSTKVLYSIKSGSVGCAITSPPYYNAREYSQWGTLILYLIDMMDNARSVNRCLVDSGIYLYNIGDIVSNDNVYVKSMMSKRRLMLGCYSMMIFEIVGFHTSGNIIWDKGEVQSKRSSTVNMAPGFVKCINCYEHVIVFSKDIKNIEILAPVVKINPVIKINNKGENTYKHTAPYPLDLVSLIEPYIIKGKYVLDPFLGSGTTLKWCRIHGYKGIGIELNKEYYELSMQYIFEERGE